MQLDLTPDPAVPFFTQRATLEGRDYDFAFEWNDRTSLWYLTVSTQAGEVLCQSRALRHRRNILARCNSPNRPPGTLFCWVTTPADLSAPKIGELGGRARIYYATASGVL